MTNAFITGSRGFIGAQLVIELGRMGWNIRTLSRLLQPESRNHDCRIGDLTDPLSLPPDILDNIDVIFHCAGEVNDPTQMHLLHIDGTSHLLEKVRRQMRRTKSKIHWVQLSSVGVYGSSALSDNFFEHQITESTTCNPLGEYEFTKWKSDEIVKKFAQSEPNFSYSVLRPSNVIGPTMSNQSLRALVHAIKRRRFFYIGSKNSIATYVHVNDVVAALILCATFSRARGQIFNLSYDCLLSELVNAVCSRNGIAPPNMVVPEIPLRFIEKTISLFLQLPLTQQRIDALVRRVRYPIYKIQNELGFIPRVAIPEAVAEMF